MAKNELGNLDHHQIVENNETDEDPSFYIIDQAQKIMKEHNIKNAYNMMTLQLNDFVYFFFVKIENNLLIFKFKKDNLIKFIFFENLKNFNIRPHYNDKKINFNNTEEEIYINGSEIIHNSQLTELVHFITPILLENNKKQKYNHSF